MSEAAALTTPAVASDCAWRERLSLAQDRVWRWALFGLLLLGIAARWGVAEELRGHAILRMHEWPGSESSQWMIAADRTAGGDWWMERAIPIATPAMVMSRPAVFWIRDWESRLPRGTLGLYLLAHSRFITGEAALYLMFSLVAGGLVPVLVAMTVGRFHSRGAGLMAGILIALNSTLIFASLRIGPWAWDVAVLALLLWTGRRAWDDRSNPAEWAIFGIVIGASLWLRPMFLWGLPLGLVPFFLHREKPRWVVLVALLLPLAASTSLMLSRHWRAEAPMIPMVGHPAWDFARSWNPEAINGPCVPQRLEIYEASEGSLPRLLMLTVGDARARAVLSPLLLQHTRAMIGARDEAVELDIDYVRRRSLWMQWLSIAPDAAMAMGWAAFGFLLLRRRLPRGLGLLVAITVGHGILFGATGDERGPLQLLLAIAAALAIMDVWELRRRRPLLMLAFAGCWGLLHLLLQLDDRERGARFRYEDFARSNNMLYRSAMSAQERQEAIRELDDWTDREEYERAFDLLGRENLRILQRR